MHIATLSEALGSTNFKSCHQSHRLRQSGAELHCVRNLLCPLCSQTVDPSASGSPEMFDPDTMTTTDSSRHVTHTSICPCGDQATSSLEDGRSINSVFVVCRGASDSLQHLCSQPLVADVSLETSKSCRPIPRKAYRVLLVMITSCYGMQ